MKIKLYTPNKILKKILENIENERIYLNLTQKDVCKKIDMPSRTYTRKIKNGTFTLIEIIKLLKVLKLDNTIEQLIELDEKPTVEDIKKIETIRAKQKEKRRVR